VFVLASMVGMFVPVDVVGVLGESCVGIGGKRNVVHVVVEEDGGDDRALWDAEVDVSVGR